MQLALLSREMVLATALAVPLLMFGQVQSALDALVPKPVPCLVEGWDASVKHLQDQQRVTGKKVLLVTHASKVWDRKAVIESQVNERVREAVTDRTPVLYLVHDESNGSRELYYVKYRPDYLVHSDHGEHQIEIDAETVELSGGFFQACSKHTAQDVVLHAKRRNGRPPKLSYLTDSLYAFGPNWDVVPLKQILKPMDDSEMLEYLDRAYLARTGLRSATYADYTFDISRNGKKIGTLGRGATRVQMDFVTADQPAKLKVRRPAEQRRVQ